MKTTSYYPVIQTDKVKETVNFYTRNFRFKPLFETDWYVHLQSKEDAGVNLAILRYDHETIPAQARQCTTGLILNFEVSDPDKEYQLAKKAGVPIVKTLRDETFGQRHFIAMDPNGVLIDVIKPIEPEEEFTDAYAQGAVPK